MSQTLFIAPSAYSIGELVNAIEIARTLPDPSQARFLVAGRNVDYVRASGFAAEKLPRGSAAAKACRQVVADADLDAVVLADHHLLGLERVGFTIDDVLGGAPLVAVDSLAFGGAGRTLELAVSKVSDNPMVQKFFPAEVTLPTLPEQVPLLRPVPVAPAVVADEGTRRIRSFDLYGDRLPRDIDVAAVRARLGVEPHRKLVMLAMSNWATTAMTKPGLGAPNRDRDAVYQLRMRWFAELLRRIDEPIALVGVSADALPATGQDVQIITSGYLPLAEFTELLAAADLYLTDNITSGALARAVLLGTPAVVLTHEHETEAGADAFTAHWREEMSEQFPGFDFPYLVNPFGWLDELQPLLTDNDYLRVLTRVDAYDLAAQVAACRAALLEPDAHRHVRDALDRQRQGLPTGGEALHELRQPAPASEGG